MMMKGVDDTCVYRHLKPCSEVFYVGIGCEKRPYDTNHRNQFWYNVVNKYGYEVEIVAECLSWAEACELEKMLIAHYGRRDLGTGTLVNMTDGGEGVKGLVFTEEHRQKLSAAAQNMSEETRQKISAANSGENNPNYGKKCSEETLQKLSAALSGEKHYMYGKPSKKRKLTFKQAQEIRSRYKNEKTSTNKLGAEYGVSGMTIYNIINNKSYTKPE